MSRPNWKTVFAESYSDQAVERLRALGEVVVLDACDKETLIRAIEDCDALLVRTSSRVTADVLAQAHRLRVIGRGGVGVDNIDLAAARERGITVVHTPGAATDAAADLTIGFIVALVRRFRLVDAMVRTGEFWEARGLPPAAELSELTLGILGMGRIGTEVARRCRTAFGMKIVYNDIRPIAPLDFNAEPRAKDQLYAESDIVSLHVPLTRQTRGLIDSGTLCRFKRGSYLINTARGAVVDSEALADALRNGDLAGAALDVFEPEPLPPNHPLLSATNTLFTAHIGARTGPAQARMNDVVEDVARVLEGKPPLYPAEPPDVAP
jgi:D-3-phosphoglycerate dehydrogenase